ncbi:MAG: tRNA-dihydrouridine synthase, partial [Candidatus Pacebacteria bacterium]|nr:tRNA-dihydrouridine synthase [Candidatus Paceibacterota bacterium]
TKVPVLTIHGRTRKELSLTDARWDDIAKVVEMAKGTDTLIIGNGDVKSIQKAQEKVQQHGVDGVMVGRGVFGDPWFFNQNVSKENLSLEEVLRVMVEHTKLFEEKLGDVKNFAIIKKHFKAYATGFDGAKELRIRLMEVSSADEVEEIVEEFLEK